MDGPLGMRQQLHDLLRLRIAERITHADGLLCVQRTGRGAVEMVRFVGEMAGVRSMDSRPIYFSVVGWTIGQSVRSATQDQNSQDCKMLITKIRGMERGEDNDLHQTGVSGLIIISV